jgi:opacity protein-like surface antigen
MKRLSLLAVLALVAAPLSAQDTTKTPTAKVAGNWDFNFTSGTANTDFGAVNVSDGWVTGNDISFTLNLNVQGTAISVNFAGTVKGDTASGQIDVPNVGIQPFPFTAVRAAGEFASVYALRSRTITAVR